MRIRIWLARGALVMGSLVLAGIVILLIYQRFSDGPTGPLPGGPFSSGEVVSAPVTDWTPLAGDFEFELVGEQSSRTAGGLLVDGNLYISCDLGFIWSRLPDGLPKNMLHTIWWFKTWHEKALLDGRVRIRKDGRVYSGDIEKVQDPQLVGKLKRVLEAEAAKFFGPDALGPPPEQPPNDIWFFRVRQQGL